MKLLMIGMDGVQQATFKRGWTPFIESLISGGAALNLEEDLISRGWAEIFTGRHATETGTLYERPVLDGTYVWTDKCRLDGIPGLGAAIKPLWQVLNERGYRVGIMNVPTTNPAPQVDGFFVSGGGGGRGVQQTVAPEQCYPVEIKTTLDEMQYIVDERLGSLLREKGLFEPEGYFSQLSAMTERRTGSFIRLGKELNIDFGFLVYRSSVMAEQVLLPELRRQERGEPVNQELLDAGAEFFRQLDSHVESLVEAFPEAEVVLVSDHSTAAREYTVNFNALLRELGYQQQPRARRGGFHLIRRLRKALPSRWVRRVKQVQGAQRMYRSFASFDPRQTQAFNVSHAAAAHGIYINDESRFGGPVSQAEKANLCERIIADFNQHPEVQRHQMRAFLPAVPEGDFRQAYPDIFVRMPEGYMPFNEYPVFVKEFERRNEPIDLPDLIEKDGRVSVKGHYPLAVVWNGEWRCSPRQGAADLRLIYEHVLSFFQAPE